MKLGKILYSVHERKGKIVAGYPLLQPHDGFITKHETRFGIFYGNQDQFPLLSKEGKIRIFEHRGCYETFSTRQEAEKYLSGILRDIIARDEYAINGWKDAIASLIISIRNAKNRIRNSEKKIKRYSSRKDQKKK